MENITIKVLASRLNLSATTISKALQDSYEISEPTKKRVRELAAELNYTPNTYASSLRTKKSQTIGIVLPDVADHFFALAIKGIEAVARQNGYHVLIYLTHEDYHREKEILAFIKKGRIDGLLISVTKNTSDVEHIAAVMEENIPVVFFDRVMEQVMAAKVVTNDFDSAYQATAHLIKNGCKKVKVCTISQDLELSNQRVAGYKKALEDYRMSFDKDSILFCPHEDEAYEQMLDLLRGDGRPDGIVAMVDKLTIPLYHACAHLGIVIPNDLKVISFSNNPSAGILNPSLTTVTQPAFLMGQTAASLLIDALGPKKHQLELETTLLPSELIFRNSSQRC